jgi:hypothetical protein
MNDDALRAAYRELLEAPREGRGGCPPPETLEALAARRGPEAARLATLNHAMACRECRRELDLLRAIEHARRAPVWTGRTFALAATLMLAVGAVLVWRSLRPDAPGALRGGGNQVSLVSPAEGARVSAPPPLRLVWRAVANAAGYRVEVLDVTGAVVATGAGPDTTLELPAGALVPADSAYRWRVIAELQGGGTVPSGFRRLTLTSP